MALRPKVNRLHGKRSVKAVVRFLLCKFANQPFEPIAETEGLCERERFLLYIENNGLNSLLSQENQINIP